MSPGFFRNKPTNFTTLVKQNMKITSQARRIYLSRELQPSLPHQQEKSKSGSTTNASEVKVATCKA